MFFKHLQGFLKFVLSENKKQTLFCKGLNCIYLKKKQKKKRMIDELHELLDTHEGPQRMMDGLHFCEHPETYCRLFTYANCDRFIVCILFIWPVMLQRVTSALSWFLIPPPGVSLPHVTYYYIGHIWTK